MFFIRVVEGPLGVLLGYGPYIALAGVMTCCWSALLGLARLKPLPATLILLFVFRAVLAFRRIATGAKPPLEEIAGVLILLAATVAFVQPKRWDIDVLRALRQCSLTAFVVLGIYMMINLYLDIFQSRAVNWNGRFFGLYSHPNEFGISIVLLLSLALYSFPLRGLVGKAILISITALVGFYVFRTGSRTAGLAFLMAILPYAWVAIRRIGVLITAGLAGFAALVLWSAQADGPDVESLLYARIFSVSNTRNEVFSLLYNNFLNNPFIGDPSGTGATSNSFLYAASSTGILGLVFLFAAIVYFVGVLLRLIRANRAPWLGRSSEGNYVAAYLVSSSCAIFVSLLLSGYLLEVMQFPLMYLLLFLAISSRLLERLREGSFNVRLAERKFSYAPRRAYRANARLDLSR